LREPGVRAQDECGDSDEYKSGGVRQFHGFPWVVVV
jgi:hypothetical protein